MGWTSSSGVAIWGRTDSSASTASAKLLLPRALLWHRKHSSPGANRTMSTAFNPSAAEASPASADTAGDRRPLWELAVGYGFLLLALWSEGDLRWAWAAGLALWIAGVTLYHRPSRRQ